VAISDGFGSSVHKTIFTYQVAVFKRRYVIHNTTQHAVKIEPLAAVIVVAKGGVGTGTMVTGVMGSGWHHTVVQLSARILPNTHGAHCVINPSDAKAWFPALSPGHHTLMYANVVSEHNDFYNSVHTSDGTIQT